MNLPAYDGPWADDDPHANFKAEVAAYSKADPRPALTVLSASTGIPVPSLVRYVLARWVGSGADLLLHMDPIVLQQMQEQVEQAEATGSDVARLQAYHALRQIIGWLKFGEAPAGAE